MIRTVKIESPLGELLAGATDDGICLLEFNNGKRAVTEAEDLVRLLDQPIEDGLNEHLIKLINEIDQYFKGSLREFTVQLVTAGH